MPFFNTIGTPSGGPLPRLVEVNRRAEQPYVERGYQPVGYTDDLPALQPYIKNNHSATRSEQAVTGKSGTQYLYYDYFHRNPGVSEWYIGSARSEPNWQFEGFPAANRILLPHYAPNAANTQIVLAQPPGRADYLTLFRERQPDPAQPQSTEIPLGYG